MNMLWKLLTCIDSPEKKVLKFKHLCLDLHCPNCGISLMVQVSVLYIQEVKNSYGTKIKSYNVSKMV